MAEYEHTITTPEQVAELPVGQWVIDARGTKLCLVDTHMGWPQRMWMTCGGRSFTAIEAVAYPLALADIGDKTPCPHSWGTNECGHCNRCGVVVADARPMRFESADDELVVRVAAAHNARIEEARRGN